MSAMLCLIGEQPIPNLLAVRYLRPDNVVLAFTEKSREAGRRLEELLKKQHTVFPLPVLPFDIQETQRLLTDFLSHRGWSLAEILFNLSGGTKAMSFAAYRLADEWRSPFVYIESEEERVSRIIRYSFDEHGSLRSEPPEIIPPVISLDDYLKAHLGPYHYGGFGPPPGGDFERDLHEVLAPVVDEITSKVQHPGVGDIDLAFRVGNQVGISEVKAGRITKDAIEQLHIACRRESLGTYTKKFLIVGSSDPTRTHLLDLARASEITVIDLPSYAGRGSLSSDDKKRLVRVVMETLGQ